VTSEYDHGCIQLALSPAGASKVWENQNILGKFQGAILDGGFLYANSSGTVGLRRLERRLAQVDRE